MNRRYQHSNLDDGTSDRITSYDGGAVMIRDEMR